MNVKTPQSVRKPMGVKKRYKVNLPQHLSHCELNYQCLSRLLPSLGSLLVNYSQEFIVGHHTHSEARIRFTVVEQTKYTTVVHIVQYCRLQSVPDYLKTATDAVLSGKDSGLSEVDHSHKSLLSYQGDVRLYHDASLAEVVKCQRYHRFSARYEYPNVDMHQADEKAQINRFLGELLAHCLSHGRMADVIFDQATVS